MKLSVIIPVYNVEKYLERCISSVINQDIEPHEYEIILINDGSTDNSLEVVYKLKERYSNIVALTQENKGQAAARNVGIKVSKGEYIFFVDSDDFVETCVFKEMLDKMETVQPEILVTQSKSMKEDGTFGNIFCPPFPKMKVLTGEYVLTKGYRPASVWAKMFRKDFITKHINGFYEGIIHEDVLFCMQLFTYAQRIAFLNVVSYVYFYNPLSTDRLVDSKKLEYSINSDIVIAKEYKCFSYSSHLSANTSKIFLGLSNGLTMNTVYTLFKSHKVLDVNIRKQMVSKMVEMGLIPIKGKTNSTRGKIFKLLLRFPTIIKIVYSVQNVIFPNKQQLAIR